MAVPETTPRADMHWAEYRHPDDTPCPDPEQLAFTPRQWVETPDDQDGWPGVQCGGCGQLLEAVT